MRYTAGDGVLPHLLCLKKEIIIFTPKFMKLYNKTVKVFIH